MMPVMSLPINPKICELWWSSAQGEHIFFVVDPKTDAWRLQNLPPDATLEHTVQADHWIEAKQLLFRYLAEIHAPWKELSHTDEFDPQELIWLMEDGWPSWGWSCSYC